MNEDPGATQSPGTNPTETATRVPRKQPSDADLAKVIGVLWKRGGSRVFDLVLQGCGVIFILMTISWLYTFGPRIVRKYRQPSLTYGTPEAIRAIGSVIQQDNALKARILASISLPKNTAEAREMFNCIKTYCEAADQLDTISCPGDFRFAYYQQLCTWSKVYNSYVDAHIYRDPPYTAPPEFLNRLLTISSRFVEPKQGNMVRGTVVTPNEVKALRESWALFQTLVDQAKTNDSAPRLLSHNETAKSADKKLTSASGFSNIGGAYHGKVEYVNKTAKDFTPGLKPTELMTNAIESPLQFLARKSNEWAVAFQRLTNRTKLLQDARGLVTPSQTNGGVK
jgi:hypothetical protein